jgi:hypothetical protein
MAEELQLAWMGDFDSLKQFVSEKLNLNGEWVSPGAIRNYLMMATYLFRGEKIRNPY